MADCLKICIASVLLASISFQQAVAVPTFNCTLLLQVGEDPLNKAEAAAFVAEMHSPRLVSEMASRAMSPDVSASLMEGVVPAGPTAAA